MRRRRSRRAGSRRAWCRTRTRAGSKHRPKAAGSGWRSAADQTRRIIHFYDECDVGGGGLVLRRAWLNRQLMLPGEHIDEYHATAAENLRRGEWSAEGTETIHGL